MDTDIDLRLEKSCRPRSDQERERKKKKSFNSLREKVIIKKSIRFPS